MAYTTEEIAEFIHETLSVWLRVRGGEPHPSWADTPDWMRTSTIESVEHVLQNPDAGPGMQHIQWMAQKKRDGWTYGEVKDADAKTHPMLVPFEDLPDDERAKDALMIAIVKALKSI